MWAQHSALTQLKQKKRNLFVCVYQTLFMGVPQITDEVFASRAKWNRKLIFRTSNIIDWGEKNKFKFLINNALLSASLDAPFSTRDWCSRQLIKKRLHAKNEFISRLLIERVFLPIHRWWRLIIDFDGLDESRAEPNAYFN